MQKTFRLLHEDFESSTTQTPQYLAFHRTFKRELTALLKSLGCSDIKVSKPNHFDVSGFFRSKVGQIWYFRLGDLRWFKGDLLIRTATGFLDYTGGRNQFILLRDAPAFVTDLEIIIR